MLVFLVFGSSVVRYPGYNGVLVLGQNGALLPGYNGVGVPGNKGVLALGDHWQSSEQLPSRVSTKSQKI